MCNLYHANAVYVMVDALKGKVGFSGNGIGRSAEDICQDAVRGTAIFFSKKVDCD